MDYVTYSRTIGMSPPRWTLKACKHRLIVVDSNVILSLGDSIPYFMTFIKCQLPFQKEGRTTNLSYTVAQFFVVQIKIYLSIIRQIVTLFTHLPILRVAGPICGFAREYGCHTGATDGPHCRTRTTNLRC